MSVQTRESIAEEGKFISWLDWSLELENVPGLLPLAIIYCVLLELSELILTSHIPSANTDTNGKDQLWRSCFSGIIGNGYSNKPMFKIFALQGTFPRQQCGGGETQKQWDRNHTPTHWGHLKPPAGGFSQGLKQFSVTLCHRSVGTNKQELRQRESTHILLVKS